MLGFLLACGMFAMAYYLPEPDDRPGFFLWAITAFAALFLLTSFCYLFQKKYLLVDGRASEALVVKQTIFRKKVERIALKDLKGILLRGQSFEDEGKKGVNWTLYVERADHAPLCMGSTTNGTRAHKTAQTLADRTGSPLREEKPS